MSARVGTLEWTRRTGGRLSRREQAAQVAELVRGQLAAIPPRAAAAAGLRRDRIARLDPRDVPVPDTAAAREAEVMCEEAQPAFIAGHARRTYLWGALLAAGDGLDFDAELLYVAALVHDVGIAESTAAPCFTLRSADAAGRVGLPPERERRVAEAITLHMNAAVPAARHGAEAHLVNAGAALDVVGLRHWELHRSTLDAVLELHPRLDFTRRWDALVRDHARRAPGCRTHLLVRAGIGVAMRLGPFDE